MPSLPMGKYLSHVKLINQSTDLLLETERDETVYFSTFVSGCGSRRELNTIREYIQAKTNDRRVRRFGDILAPLSRETKLNMRFQE